MANDTKYITLENLTRLASKIKADIQLKQDQLQFAELPDATAYADKVVQYIGDDTAELKAGAFYKSDGTTWVGVTPSAEGGGGLPVVETMPISPSDKDIVLYVGNDTSSYKKGHIYQAHTNYAVGDSDYRVYFNTPNITQDSQVVAESSVKDNNPIAGWWFHSFGDGYTTLCRVKGSDDPSDQTQISGGRYSAGDYSEWVQVNGAAFTAISDADIEAAFEG